MSKAENLTDEKNPPRVSLEASVDNPTKEKSRPQTTREFYSTLVNEYHEVRAMPCSTQKWLRMDALFALFGSTCFDLAKEERVVGDVESQVRRARDELGDLSGDGGEVVVVVVRAEGETPVSVAVDKEVAARAKITTLELREKVRSLVGEYVGVPDFEGV